MSMPKVYLTDTLVARAKCPPDKDQELFWDNPIGDDGRVRHGAIGGLALRVTAQGAKSFIHGYVFNGRRRRKVLGPATVHTVASARLLVAERERQLAAGNSPDETADPRKTRKLTVRDAIDQYWNSHIATLSPAYQYSFAVLMAAWWRQKPQRVTRRGHNIKKSYTDFGTLHGERRLASIKPLDIERFLAQFASPHRYNDARRHLTALFNWAIRMQLVDMRNPCSPIKVRKIVRERRTYTLEEIGRIAGHIFAPPLSPLPAIDHLHGLAKRDAGLARARINTTNAQMVELCNFMGILLLTMARPSDVLRAEFSHFDLKALVWHKHNTKGIKLAKTVYEYAYRSVPIHPKVAEIVLAQRQRWPDSQLLFPAQHDPTRPRDNFRKGLTRFKAPPGVPAHFQLYDLKRIAISLMITGQGVSREAVSHYVDHRGNLETTLIYDLGLVDPLRPVTKRLGELLELDG